MEEHMGFQRLQAAIRRTHGSNIAKKSTTLKNLTIKLAKAESRNVFLLQHRQTGAVPRFIRQKSVIFNSLKSQVNDNDKHIERAQKRLEQTILNIEISICVRHIKYTQNRRVSIDNLIKTSMDESLYNDLSMCVNQMYDKIRSKCKETQSKKLQENIKKSCPAGIRFQEEFCVNMTGKEVPTEVLQLLGLGQCFALPITKRETPLLDLIAETDDIISSSKSNDKENIRTLITKDYVQFIGDKDDKFLSREDKHIQHLYNVTRKYLKENPDVYVVNSDKGQKTVLMTKETYREKMHEHLSDRNVYIPIHNNNSDINNVLKRRNNNLIEELYVKGQLTKPEKNQLTVSDCIPPRIYGTFKTHKPNLPIRPVISSVNTATRPLCDKIQSILACLPLNEMDVKNSDTFKERIENVGLENNEVCISLDVVSLYTNINQKEAISACMRRWEQIKQHTTISKVNFERLLELCIFESGFFLYEDQFFKQIQGLPMGNPLSGMLATFVLNDFLTDFFKNDQPKILCKYVDDMFLIIKKSKIRTTIQNINKAHETLKFTLENEVDNKIPFLDTLVIREGNTVHTNWYKKPIASGRLLNYLSSHPNNVKKNIATAFAQRVIRLSHPKYHTQNYTTIEEILSKNNYPPRMIRRIINNIKYVDQPRTMPHTTQDKETMTYRSLPYVPVLSDKIRSNVTKLDENIRLGMKPTHKLQSLFTKTKTEVYQPKKGFCYRIKCKGKCDDEETQCSKVYIGETGRDTGKEKSLPPRIKEHISTYKSALKRQGKTTADREITYKGYRTRNKQNELETLKAIHRKNDREMRYQNAALDHAMHEGHVFDYENVEIMKYSSHYKKRKALESMYIVLEGDKAVNYKTDTMYMHNNTRQVLNLYRETT